ncbi:MAG: family 65 glycosyl hydrolase domain-containing protein [Saprospiraceae bacterium]
MKQYITHHEWKVIEDGFYPAFNKITESICSLGNGYMGHRGNFEEAYSGESLQGNYLAGIYYPDKTRVGWWKNGYPEYFAKVLNAVNWIGLDLTINGVVLDLAQSEVLEFNRTLDMQRGCLERTALVKTSAGTIRIHSQRFCSIVRRELGAIKYTVTPVDFDATIELGAYLDFDVRNEDSNYDEKFWNPISAYINGKEGAVVAETKKTAFQVAAAMHFEVYRNADLLSLEIESVQRSKYVAGQTTITAKAGESISICKYAGIMTSENHDKANLQESSLAFVREMSALGFDKLLTAHTQKWAEKWEESDIRIEGDVAGQQGIRFCIFQMNQTYTGEDERLNIGPKGFTGEKYGGSTYWDTEAYCVPFYLATADSSIARNLLIYRHRHLEKAIENAAKLGFTDGAALYPMVTMNGEECHNEWEITFEEIHRNGAIAYAISDYINYTGDQAYLAEYGLEVLVGITRFWSQRVNYSEAKGKYVMLGVTGPNEYENNVNNNWYTNYIATWCMRYTLEAIDYVKKQAPEAYQELAAKINFKEAKETSQWQEIIEKMYYPTDEERGVFLQQDGFLDKALHDVTALGENDRPICQNWSWDRILRSCYIKQADVLQGLYFFESEFDLDTIRRNFQFYEPMTTHESSLSPCVHAILAAKIGDHDLAYEMYLRTARLDLDDYNNDTEDGLHITSMGGTWMSFVKGFSGMRVVAGQLSFQPFLPASWKGYSFKIRFRNALLKVSVTTDNVYIKNESETAITVLVAGTPRTIDAQQKVEMTMAQKI